MNKSNFLIGFFLFFSIWNLFAEQVPEVWYRPDSLVSLSQEDSVSWTDEYTVFSVVRSLDDSTPQCLWSFAEDDTVSTAILTRGIYTSNIGTLHFRNPHDFSKWSVYAFHSGICADSIKQCSLRLGEQMVYTDTATIDTLHSEIEMEEFAYFRGNVSKHASDAFQTYLALKYGVTLDYAPYISQSGDTLWHPTHDEEFYHRVVGLGNDTICGWTGCVSPVPGSIVEPRWSDIHLSPELQYISDFLTGTTGTPVRDTVVFYPDVQVRHTTSYSSSSPYRQLFGPLHRGWGAFAYQNLHNHDTILLDSLVNTQQLAAESAQQNPNIKNNQTAQSFSPNGDWQSQVDAAFAEGNLFNPVSNADYWIPMHADSRTGQWIAYGNMGCIGRSVHSNAREIIIQNEVEDIVEYDTSVPFVQGDTRKNNFVRKQSRSTQQSVSWGVLGIVNQSASTGTYESVVDYMDMNGDGLPDKIKVDNNQVQVAYNCGMGSNGMAFDTWKPLPGIAAIGSSTTSSYTTNLGVTGGFTFLGIVKFNIGVQSSPYGESFSRTEVILTDMDGDGLTDYVWQDGNGQIHVRYNTAGRANLLTAVTNPTGQQILLDYGLSEPSVSHKHRQWELRQIVDVSPNHPIIQAQRTTVDVAYADAYYDNYEKTDYGYRNVRTTINNEKIKDAYYN